MNIHKRISEATPVEYIEFTRETVGDVRLTSNRINRAMRRHPARKQAKPCWIAKPSERKAAKTARIARRISR